MIPAHILIPADATLPALYATENVKDPVAQVKLFTPDAGWTWYITEYDPAERRAFGMVVGLETEIGYISIDELEAVRGPMGLKIERDLHWTPRPLSQCK
jgi:hypothetical protein